jgi:hypothetical protein
VIGEGPGIDLTVSGDITTVGLGGDTILLYNSNLDPVEEFPATDAGLTAALAAAVAGDEVLLPICEITGGPWTIPAGISLHGQSRYSYLIGTITNNGFASDFEVSNLINTGTALHIYATPVAGNGIEQSTAGAVIERCWIQTGIAATYGIDISDGYLFNTIVGTDGGSTNIGIYVHGPLVEVNNCRFAGYVGGIVEQAYIVGNTEFYSSASSPALTSHGMVHTTSGTVRMVNCNFICASANSFGAYITNTGLTLTDCNWNSISGLNFINYGTGDRSPLNHTHTNPAIISYVTGDLSNPPTEVEFEAICGTPASAGAGSGFLVLDTDTSRVYLAISDGTNYQYSPFIGPASGTPSGALAGAAGAWCWFGDPRAVYYNGYTYYGYISNTGHVTIHRYINATQVNGLAVVLHTNLGIDDHNAPSFLIRDSDKRIMAWYSAHSGPKMYQRISTNPEDVSTWGAETDLQPSLLGSEFSYPDTIQLTGEANDPIYLFWRNPYDGTSQAWWYSKSTNDGATWAARTMLFKVENKSAYMKVVQNGADRIDFVVTDEHPYYSDPSIYHFYYQGGNFYKTDGTAIGHGPPFDETDPTKVYDGVAGNPAWLWDIAIDGSDNPIITFATFPTTSDHRYQYARWTGAAWDVHEITAGGGGFGTGVGEEYYSGGVVLDHSDPQIVYLSKVVAGKWEIYKYTTADGGANWANAAVTTGSSSKNIRPVVVRDHGANLTVLWLYGTYTTYLNYSMSIYGGAP